MTIGSYFAYVFGTTFVVRPFEELVQEAPYIVRGTVGQSFPKWVQNPNGGRTIVTDTELFDVDFLKGNPSGKSLYVRELGGSLDGVTLGVEGRAQFHRGEEVVVLLNSISPDGAHTVREMSFGRFELVVQDGVVQLKGPALEGQGVWSLERLRAEIIKGVTKSPNGKESAQTVRPKATALSQNPEMEIISNKPNTSQSFWILLVLALVAIFFIARLVSRKRPG